MAGCGYGPGPDGVYDTPPLAAQGDQAWRTAATYAAIAVLAALAWPGPDGQDDGGGGEGGGGSAGGPGPVHRCLGPRVLGDR